MTKYLLSIFIVFIALHNVTVGLSEDSLKKAIILFNNEQYVEAQEILEEIIDNNENNAEAYFYLGRTLMMLQEFDDAADSFEEAVELDKNNADYYFWLGQALGADAINSNMISRAFLAPKIKEAFQKAVEIDPKHLRGNIGLVNFHLNAPGILGGDLEEAYNIGKNLITIDEKSGRTVMLNYFLKKELFDSVSTQLKIFENKFSNDRSLASFYNRFGYSLIKHKKYEEAIKYFKKQIEIIPDQANPYDSLGDGYKAAGKYELAREQYSKALSIDPNFKSSKDNLAKIEELLKK